MGGLRHHCSVGVEDPVLAHSRGGDLPHSEQHMHFCRLTICVVPLVCVLQAACKQAIGVEDVAARFCSVLLDTRATENTVLYCSQVIKNLCSTTGGAMQFLRSSKDFGSLPLPLTTFRPVKVGFCAVFNHTVNTLPSAEW